mmetsp:Transcript_4595/g.9364  ORF Transcript_4595/g.9364 Transcript_4595/m.9364 type:complete len:236 (+) Transcript_4595:204-911(+)
MWTSSCRMLSSISATCTLSSCHVKAFVLRLKGSSRPSITLNSPDSAIWNHPTFLGTFYQHGSSSRLCAQAGSLTTEPRCAQAATPVLSLTNLAKAETVRFSGSSKSPLMTLPSLSTRVMVGKPSALNAVCTNSRSSSPRYLTTSILLSAANFSISSSMPWQNWHHGAYVTTSVSLPLLDSFSASAFDRFFTLLLPSSQRSRSQVFSAPATWMPHSVLVDPSLFCRPTNRPFRSAA